MKNKFNLDAEINTYLHYRNFNGKEIEVWGKKEKNLHYYYNDRLEMIFGKKTGDVVEKTDKKIKGNWKFFYNKSPRWHQEYLRIFTDNKKIKLRHILKTINVSNDHDLIIYGFKVE